MRGEVVCISCGDCEDITIGQLYEVINNNDIEFYNYDSYHRIINDYGEKVYYYKNHFKTLDIIREETINRLLI